MAGPERRFLSFDGRDGGRTAEVFGDLSRAGRMAVLVPGSDTGLDRYGRLRAGAAALQRELGGRSAVVAWLGYRTPGTVSPQVLTPGRADAAAPALRRFVAQLRATRPAARTSLLCHSYGAVVCGRAAPGLDVAHIVLYGSPGAGADNATGMRTRATVWAGRGAGDWLAPVPHARLRLPCTTVGLGADPVSPEFGARAFPAKDASAAELAQAVRVVAAGDALLAPNVTKRLITEFSRLSGTPRAPLKDRVGDLTERGTEVLSLIAQGLSNAEIAGRLVVAEQTVKTHVSRILLKLGLRDRTQAAVFAYETGLVRPAGY
ncbi:alpha/beta hydrolase [Streptomyces chryseus]|nr:alpha/beta hydrolase [Streptomyces chryseus]